MYPPPAAELAEATVTELDDQFFTSDPFAYIRARIVALLSDEPVTLRGPAAEEFSRLLGPSAMNYASVDDRVRELQVAVDAFALRHQVAETLVRFLHVVLHHAEDASHWVDLVDTPTQTIDVVKQNYETLAAAADGAGLLRSVLLPAEFSVNVHPSQDRNTAAGSTASGSAVLRSSESVPANTTGESDDELVPRALAVHVGWINYAIALLGQKSPDLNAAHNKFKHGMGLRPQDDVLSTFTTTPPNPDGGVPLSALTGDQAFNLFDGITTEFLARRDKKHGLEITQIAMVPAPTLVEAASMAHTLALVFHSAAAKHFTEHAPVEGRKIPDHPGLLIDGPQAGTLRPLQPFALRFPLTTPLRNPDSPHALLFWTNGDINTMTFGERMTGVVVDDPQKQEPGPDDDLSAV